MKIFNATCEMRHCVIRKSSTNLRKPVANPKQNALPAQVNFPTWEDLAFMRAV